MCGAFGYDSKIDPHERYNFTNNVDLRHSYNIRPFMKTLVVNQANEGQIQTFAWKAPWGGNLLNAKAETAHVLKSFAKMFRESRVIIPASFFFEWQKHEDKTKTPFLFKLKDTDAFSFAGISNEEENAFAILTTTPNLLMEDVHARMPVILPREFEEVWLNPDTEVEQLSEILIPYDHELMERYEVSTLVNNYRNQTAEIIKPV